MTCSKTRRPTWGTPWTKKPACILSSTPDRVGSWPSVSLRLRGRAARGCYGLFSWIVHYLWVHHEADGCQRESSVDNSTWKCTCSRYWNSPPWLCVLLINRFSGSLNQNGKVIVPFSAYFLRPDNSLVAKENEPSTSVFSVMKLLTMRPILVGINIFLFIHLQVRALFYHCFYLLWSKYTIMCLRISNVSNF